jgi:hypothetical protein
MGYEVKLSIRCGKTGWRVINVTSSLGLYTTELNYV